MSKYLIKANTTAEEMDAASRKTIAYQPPGG
jgi:hypothetical protein